MRNIEKGLLLAEYFGADTSSHVCAFIDWIRQSEEYALFLKRKEELHHKTSERARRTYFYYTQIDLDDITSIEEGMILYGKIGYLLKMSDPSCYTNPLIIAYLEDEKMKLGDIQVLFDGRMVTLGELSSSKGYSLEVKEEVLRKKLNEWKRELDEQIIQPVRDFGKYKDYFPKRRIFNAFHVAELVYLTAVTFSLFFMYFCNIGVLNYVSHYKLCADQPYFCFAYSLMCTYTAIYDIYVFVVMIIRTYRFSYYNKARKVVFHDIIGEEKKAVNHLEEYVSDQLVNLGKMDAFISEFNTLTKYYEEVNYFSNRVAKKSALRSDEPSLLSKGLFLFHIALTVAFIILVACKVGGGL